MHSADFWIKNLKLQPHPEGGFFVETYRSNECIPQQAMLMQYSGNRHFSTAIFFLLRTQDCSVFHRLESDEVWHFYSGTSLTLYVLKNSGLATYKLGSNPKNHESLQVVIPSNTWLAAKVDKPDSYTLAGCTMAPGFDYLDFEIANRKKLLKDYPDQRTLIERLT